MLLPFYLILIKTNEPYLSRSYDSQFAEFLNDCYLIIAFVFSTSLLASESLGTVHTFIFAHFISLLVNKQWNIFNISSTFFHSKKCCFFNIKFLLIVLTGRLKTQRPLLDKFHKLKASLLLTPSHNSVLLYTSRCIIRIRVFLFSYSCHHYHLSYIIFFFIKEISYINPTFCYPKIKNNFYPFFSTIITGGYGPPPFITNDDGR